MADDISQGKRDHQVGAPSVRRCLRDPIPEFVEAARWLEEAVSAHIGGKFDLAEELIKRSDMLLIREWTESLWGASSPYVVVRDVPGAPPFIPKADRAEARMPTHEEKRALRDRDGYHCRFCGIPVIRDKVRRKLQKLYPAALQWGSRNADQHAAFQAMWLQYDHVVPHARGGGNGLGNIVITCAPCNYARMDFLVEEVGLEDPRMRDPVQSTWDGLERILKV